MDDGLWRDPDAFATSLLLTFVDHFTTEAFEWDPVTIRMELEAVVPGRIPQCNFDKLMTAITIVTTDLFYVSLPDFVNFCNILSGDDFNPELWDPADTFDICWGVVEAAVIEPPITDPPFDPEIVAYINAVLESEGFVRTPDILKPLLPDRDATKQLGDFSDDPEMYGAIFGAAEIKLADIEQNVSETFAKLLTQVSELRLKNGQAKDLAAGLKRLMAN